MTRTRRAPNHDGSRAPPTRSSCSTESFGNPYWFRPKVFAMNSKSEQFCFQEFPIFSTPQKNFLARPEISPLRIDIRPRQKKDKRMCASRRRLRRKLGYKASFEIRTSFFCFSDVRSRCSVAGFASAAGNAGGVEHGTSHASVSERLSPPTRPSELL